ncbi:MAG TPA: glutathione binding-like protein [Bordetella sp.]|nr:glutathione binding-like protein [Bordetella sp.]
MAHRTKSGTVCLASAQLLDAHLAGKQWIAQGRLTLADLAIAFPLMHTDAAQIPRGAYGHLQRWFAQIRVLDACKQSASRCRRHTTCCAARAHHAPESATQEAIKSGTNH